MGFLQGGHSRGGVSAGLFWQEGVEDGEGRGTRDNHGGPCRKGCVRAFVRRGWWVEDHGLALLLSIDPLFSGRCFVLSSRLPQAAETMDGARRTKEGGVRICFVSALVHLGAQDGAMLCRPVPVQRATGAKPAPPVFLVSGGECGQQPGGRGSMPGSGWEECAQCLVLLLVCLILPPLC